MPVDPNNPAAPPNIPGVNPEVLATQKRLATAAEQMVLVGSGSPVTEAAVYLEILHSCIRGRVADNSTDLQIWANDLTQDYLKKYPLPGSILPGILPVKTP